MNSYKKMMRYLINKGIINFSISKYCIRRHLSTSNELQIQLSTDVKAIYNASYLFPSLTPTQVENLSDDIRNGNYSLSPLEYQEHPLIMARNHEFISNLFKDYPDCHIFSSQKYQSLLIIKASNLTDSLLIHALSVTMQRFYYGSMDITGKYKLWDRFQEFTKTLSEQENVYKILKIDLINTLKLLTKADVIQAIRIIVDDEYVVQLLTSFINIPILGKTGNEILLNKIPKSAIPHTGELGIWLYNIVLMVNFDPEFVFRFPDIIMTRFIHEVFVIKHVDSDINALDEQALCSFLTLVGVSGTDAEDVYYKKDLCSFFRYIDVGVSETLDAISPGEGSLLCGGGLNFETMTVKINNCGYVKVFENSREDEDELLETETKE